MQYFVFIKKHEESGKILEAFMIFSYSSRFLATVLKLPLPPSSVLHVSLYLVLQLDSNRLATTASKKL